MKITYIGTSQDLNGVFIGNWFATRIGKPITPPYTAIGWGINGNLIAGVLFNDYTGSQIEAHIYGSGKITRRAIRRVFNYVFNELNCNVLRAKPEAKNEKLIELLPRLGFSFEAVLGKYYGPLKENDAIVFKLEREQAKKWLA